MFCYFDIQDNFIYILYITFTLTTEGAVPSEIPKEEDIKDGGEDSGEEIVDSKDKKKKKKKKKKEDDDKSKKIKKPGKSTILAMQEALEQVKREEERLRAEAEAKARAIEQAEEARLEKVVFLF